MKKRVVAALCMALVFCLSAVPALAIDGEMIDDNIPDDPNGDIMLIDEEPEGGPIAEASGEPAEADPVAGDNQIVDPNAKEGVGWYVWAGIVLVVIGVGGLVAYSVKKKRG